MNINKPPYYKNSKVMNSIYTALDKEMERLSNEVSLTENQFFVILADKSLHQYEQDVGLIIDSAADVDTRRSRILTKLRGSGTVTKTMVKNVANSFVNGEIEIIEYANEYAFAIKFISKKGIPYNLEDIKEVINDIKPAHLAVEYIFTYRLWQELKTTIQTWQNARLHSWESIMSFELTYSLNIANSKVYFRNDDTGNAILILENNMYYARRRV